MEQQQQNGVQSVFFLLWKENEWWRHMLRLFIHIYGAFHSVQLYTRLRTKYFTMDRNWMNIVKKKATTKQFFVVVVFGTNMRWKKEHDVILMSIINLFFFNASKHHSLFGFLRIFLFPFIDRFNNVRYVRAMRIHLYSIEWYTGHFFRLNYINYSTLSRWSLFMGYKRVDLYLIRPHTLQILTPHGT